MTSPQAAPGFAYGRDQFQQIVEDVLGHGPGSSVHSPMRASRCPRAVGLSVSVRKGEVENVERNRDKSLGVSGLPRPAAGQCQHLRLFSRHALRRKRCKAAYDIARFTAEDPAAGLPEAGRLVSHRRGGCNATWTSSTPGRIDAAGRRGDRAPLLKPRRSDGGQAHHQFRRRLGVSAQQAHFWAGNSRGFRGGYASSRHSLSVSPIAGKGREMQRDYWYTSMRDALDMASPEAVGRYAAERALSRLKSRKIATCEVPVLFENTAAAGLLGAYVQGTSGGALYRKASFLQDSLGQQVWADHIDISEDPHIRRGKGSAPFDDEGVRTRARHVLSAGVVQGYFLSTYSARKLGMTTTGHAGGSQNLRLTSRLTQPGDHLEQMLRKLGRGLFVTELMGQGVNYVTGDYSRGAAGFWVENGRIAYPVHEITIAGHLRDMLRGVVAVGADTYTMGGKTMGSMLLDRMKIAGN